MGGYSKKLFEINQCLFIHLMRQGKAAQTAKLNFTASFHVTLSMRDNREKPHATHLFFLFLMASWIIFTWTATTDRTSTEMRLNSSKQPQAPVCTNPL